MTALQCHKQKLSLIDALTGEVFSYPVHRTWEFTSQYPIRSVFPLWLFYGLPMVMLRSIWGGLGHDLSPATVYWTLRCLMFTLSFVLEDWALQELVHSTRQRRVAILLVASSYVTWTYQTHTFSNAIETLIVLWSLVLIGRIVEEKVRFLALAFFLQNLQLVGAYRYLQMWRSSILERLRHLQPYHFSGLYSPTRSPTATALPSEATRLLVAYPLWRVDYILCRLCGH